MMGTMNQAEPPAPPSADTVAWRAVSLHALVIRAEFEYAYHLTPDPEAPELAGLPSQVKALGAWAHAHGVLARLSPRESALFAAPLGSWPEADVLEISWRKESLGVLFWALSCLSDLPPYDQEFPDQAHLECLGWLRPVAEFVEGLALRPGQEIQRARAVSELWLWRARTTHLQRAQPRLAQRYNLPQIVREAAIRAYANGEIPPPIAGDFPALGKAYARLKDQDLVLLQSIARERHLALNWLCGDAEDWEETTVHT